MNPRRSAGLRLAGAAVAAGCVLTVSAPAFADSGAVGISVTVPETLWNSPNSFGMTVFPDGRVEVVDSRTASPGWSITRHLGADGTVTVTVLG